MSTQNNLLAQAEALARRGGYDGFSFADLAAEAGIRKASVHHHFPTKAHLVAALVARYAGGVHARLDRCADASAGGRLAALVDLYRDALEEGESLCLCVALSAVSGRVPEAARAEVARFKDDMRGWLAHSFELAAKDGTILGPGHPETEAAAAFATLEGAQLIARAARDIAQFDLATAQLRARIQTGAET